MRDNDAIDRVSIAVKHSRNASGKTINTEDFQMSFTTVLTALLVPVACIAAAVALMRLFDVKDATAEQVHAEIEKLLGQANREVKITRRVRAGAVTSAI